MGRSSGQKTVPAILHPSIPGTHPLPEERRMAKIKELREKRAKHIADARAINDKAVTEKRSMSAEETQQFDKLMDDADKVKGEIDALETEQRRLERLTQAEEEQRSSAGRQTEPGTPGRGAAGGGENRSRDPNAPIEFRYRTRAPAGAEARERVFELRGPTTSEEYREQYRRWLGGGPTPALPEQRTMQADDDAGGGYLIAPMQMAAGLIQRVDDAVFIRQLANVLPPLMKAQSLGAPSLDGDMDDAEWVAELDSGEDDEVDFGRRELNPHALSKALRISRRLIRLATLPAETIVLDRLTYKISVTEEKAYLTGDGVKKPLGVFTASDDGVPTSRDVSTGNTATAMTFDGLIEAKYFLKAAYWARARWLFHRDAIKMLVKIKDGDGHYIWRESVRSGEPDRLLNLPVDVSEFAPNTFTTGKYAGGLFDWSQYWIVDSLALEIQRLVETRARQNQVELIARKETDGMPVLAEAFARVKLG
jgi:HK97 family phage major capsid protein